MLKANESKEKKIVSRVQKKKRGSQGESMEQGISQELNMIHDIEKKPSLSE